ncbi:MAG: TusE/DsrC/DsvC family sulfur relay protein [Cocleimonas sp.]|nr:TusE/DsrC/DsvC family sulfur relay protein [Cocleimonas sp.]
MSNFADAPKGWNPSNTEAIAKSQQLTLTQDHWNIVEALQSYFSTHDKTEVNRRELTDALEERFHTKGGMKYLYKLLPRGPISQGCALAGISNPAGNVDYSFGSVV